MTAFRASLGAGVSIVRLHGVLWRRVRWYLHHTLRTEVHDVVVKAQSKYIRSAVGRTQMLLEKSRAGWRRILVGDASATANSSLWHHSIKWSGASCPNVTLLFGSRTRGLVVVREVMLLFLCAVCVMCHVVWCVVVACGGECV